MKTIFKKSPLSMVLMSLLVVLLGEAMASFQEEKAPSWDGVMWINLAEGQDSLDVSDLKGKVIYLSFFQKW